ncbi:hypothetical protein PsYK624_019720 [Phanerochaete sordida]|uniref:Uncharacterized protein n=1 Tax=Phanerochaete sordida TaxID=48140 RepID=A0A9P3FZ38_9APHY|nr:hypothetical protein PsYK624_019720 [Phanerochaete sordida]
MLLLWRLLREFLFLEAPRQRYASYVGDVGDAGQRADSLGIAVMWPLSSIACIERPPWTKAVVAALLVACRKWRYP